MSANTMPARPTETWSVTVLYQDTQVRQRAMRVCDHLMRRFWSEIEFDFNWWRFSFLQDEVLSQRAASHLEDADAIIVATAAAGELPESMQRWLERALAQRGERTGMFIALSGPEENPFRPPGQRKDTFLRGLAQQAGMDYFTEAPSTLPGRLPDSLENFSHRAEEHTTIIENILKHAPPPTLHS
jgi:hypothetical protein